MAYADLQHSFLETSTYSSELSRWASFETWPDEEPVSATVLAGMGFFRRPNAKGSEATCFRCGWTNRKWCKTETPLALHKRFQPNCQIFDKADSMNKSLAEKLDVDSCLSDNFAGLPAESTDQPFRAVCVDEFNIYEEPLLSKLRNETGQMDYKKEKHRLVSFLNPEFKKSCSLNPVSLARAGLFFQTKLRCAFCDILFDSWKVAGNPELVHRQFSPNCRFFSMNSDNIPWDEIEDSSRKMKLSKIGFHRCNVWPPLVNIFWKKAQSPGYKSMKLRLNSYKCWSCPNIQHPSRLADAGFFFTGRGDTVECWLCGGQLSNWKVNDDPWVEHGRFYPDCEFVLQNKGIDFIAEAKVQRHVNREQREQIWEHRFGDKFERYEGSLEKRSYLVKAILDSPVYKRLMDLGFRKDQIKEVLIDQLKINGHSFLSAVDMAKAYLEREDEIEVEFGEKSVDPEPPASIDMAKKHDPKENDPKS